MAGCWCYGGRQRGIRAERPSRLTEKALVPVLVELTPSRSVSFSLPQGPLALHPATLSRTRLSALRSFYPSKQKGKHAQGGPHAGRRSVGSVQRSLPAAGANLRGARGSYRRESGRVGAWVHALRHGVRAQSFREPTVSYCCQESLCCRRGGRRNSRRCWNGADLLAHPSPLCTIPYDTVRHPERS